MNALVIHNREGHAAFDVAWPERKALRPGLTAVVRARDEAVNLPWVLPPLLDAVDEVVFVDNLSQDGTTEQAIATASAIGASARLRAEQYPFEVARCGSEHLATPANSVHSLAHFYNWSFNQASTRYAMKWDGDMVLTALGVNALRELNWQLEADDTIVVFQHHPLYLLDDGTAFLDVQSRQIEPWIFPLGADYNHVKGFDWEMRMTPPDVRRLVMPPGLCFELKRLDEDEFSHWSSTADFDPDRSPRKIRELEVFTALRDGRFEDLDRVIRIEAPSGVHVIDHVRSTWLPQARGL